MVIGEVCNREVVIVDRDTTILEAARLMRRHHVGDVVVADARNGDRVPVGILTDRDIVVELLATEVDLEAVSVGDVMSFDLLLARDSDDLMETVKLMKLRGVRRAPVVNTSGGLVGILAVDDVVELIAEQLTDLAQLIGNEQSREREIRD